MEFKHLKQLSGITLFTVLALSAAAQARNAPDEEKSLFQLPGPGGWLPWLALLMGVIAIELHFYFYRANTKSKIGSTIKALDSTLKQELANLRGELSKRAKVTEISSLEGALKLLEARIQHLEQPQPSREIEWNIKQKPIEPAAAPIVDGNSTTQQRVEPRPEVVYAKYADLADGFSSQIISPVQNGELVYEILTTGDTAVYKISSDRDAQKYALSEFAFTLGKACDFVNQPFKGCHIVLQKDGVLTNINGDWIIQEKAKIEFK